MVPAVRNAPLTASWFRARGARRRQHAVGAEVLKAKDREFTILRTEDVLKRVELADH
ncbi:hypothetical protein AB0M48_17610 [Lentzea sp. NPDC051208]|uniref:hypothetical protein n=1 Tax=Lentzea sp. NPDC051208 TaxID=3154642 RepID=UPI0034335758